MKQLFTCIHNNWGIFSLVLGYIKQQGKWNDVQLLQIHMCVYQFAKCLHICFCFTFPEAFVIKQFFFFPTIIYVLHIDFICFLQCQHLQQNIERYYSNFQSTANKDIKGLSLPEKPLILWCPIMKYVYKGEQRETRPRIPYKWAVGKGQGWLQQGTKREIRKKSLLLYPSHSIVQIISLRFGRIFDDICGHWSKSPSLFNTCSMMVEINFRYVSTQPFVHMHLLSDQPTPNVLPTTTKYKQKPQLLHLSMVRNNQSL